MDKNLVPRLFTSYCKLLYDCFKYLLQKKSFLATPNVVNKCWTSYETLESTGEMKLMMKFCLCLHKFSELWNLFSLVPMGNCFRCYFRQLFMYLALRKCKNDCKILKIILVKDFCPLKPEIAWFSIGFRLNYFKQRLHYAGEIWKCSFMSTVKSTVHTNPSRKRSVSKTLFKPEEFENAAFSFSCGRKTFWKRSFS